MTFTLLETKLVLQEHKLILNEDLTKDLVSEKLNLVNNVLKSFESKTNPYGSIETAYNEYKSIIAKNNTTRDNTTNYGEVLAALRTFWNALKTAKLIQGNDIDLDFENDNNADANTDTTDINLTQNIIKILKPYRRLINEVSNLLATVGNDASEITRETKKKLVLKNVLEVESAFGKIVQRLKTDVAVTNADTVPIKSKLSFIQKSLAIFQQSIKYLTDEKIKDELETILNAINDVSLKKAETLDDIVDAFHTINNEVKNSKDAAAQQRAENNEANKTRAETDWKELYDNTMDKVSFWEKYYNEYWGPKANRIASLGTAFKNECEVYGFTGKTNPFIRYIKHYLFSPDLENLWNSGHYQLIHNFIVNNSHASVKDLPGYALNPKEQIANNLANFLRDPRLFKQKASDMHDYLEYAAAAKDSPKFNNLFYDKNNQLLPLPVVRQNLANEGIDKGPTPMAASAIQSCINSILATKKVDLYLIMLWSYFLDAATQEEYKSKLGDLLTKTSVSPAIVATAKNKFIKLYGAPSVPIAKQLIDGIQAAKDKQTTTEQTNATQGA